MQQQGLCCDTNVAGRLRTLLITRGPDNVVGYIHRSVIGNRIGSSSRRNTVLGLFGSRYSEKLNKLIFVNKQQKLCKVEILTTLAVCVTNSEE